MPRKDPTPEQVRQGTSQAMDTVATLLRRLRDAEGELVEAGLLAGLNWPQIAEATGKSSAKAAAEAHKRWKSGR
jgi:hypothetical protein